MRDDLYKLAKLSFWLAFGYVVLSNKAVGARNIIEAGGGLWRGLVQDISGRSKPR